MAGNEKQDSAVMEVAAPEFTRQLDIIRPEDLRIPITVIGAGGIGGFATEVLAKMGCSDITVFDPDLVEPHNIPNQRFGPSDVGRLKVDALRDFVEKSSGLKIRTMQREWSGVDKLSSIVISAVDSMAVRKRIWKKVRYNSAVRLFIDGRVGGEYSEVYAVVPVDPDSVRFYAKSLFRDRHAAELPCTARAVIYVGYGIAARIALIVRLFAKGIGFPPVIRDDYRNVMLMTK